MRRYWHYCNDKPNTQICKYHAPGCNMCARVQTFVKIFQKFKSARAELLFAQTSNHQRREHAQPRTAARQSHVEKFHVRVRVCVNIIWLLLCDTKIIYCCFNILWPASWLPHIAFLSLLQRAHRSAFLRHLRARNAWISAARIASACISQRKRQSFTHTRTQMPTHTYANHTQARALLT